MAFPSYILFFSSRETQHNSTEPSEHEQCGKGLGTPKNSYIGDRTTAEAGEGDPEGLCRGSHGATQLGDKLGSSIAFLPLAVV